MKQLSLPKVRLGSKLMHQLCFLLLSLIVSSLNAGRAQPPTSLQYPAFNSFGINMGNVNLAPTVSGQITSYTISPELPAGLSFDAATGVISGAPTAHTTNTIYTVTATNSFGTASTTFTLQTPSAFYNNNNDTIKFLATNAMVKVRNGPAGTGGQRMGDIVLYQHVTSIGGVPIDCIVKTIKVHRVGDWRAYDQDTVTSSGFTNNHPAFFSPQINFLSGGGFVVFNFQFILGGSYNDAAQAGTNVTLQQVKLNTYDLDGNANPGSNQYTSFEGFNNVELGNPTYILPSFIPDSGRTRFTSLTDTNVYSVTDPRTRVRVSYSHISNFDVKVGAGANGAAYFFLDFSSGPAFPGATAASAPIVDLNTSLPGNVNGKSDCGAAFAFTLPGEANISAGGDLNGMTVSVPVSDIKNGASEIIAFDGATTTIPLNFTGTINTSVAIGGITYNVSGVNAGAGSDAFRTISFTRSGGGTITGAQAEALLDALQYKNNAPGAIAGKRHFNVTVYNALYRSPDAVFTATVSCVLLEGHIYRDANALADNQVNPNATNGQFGSNELYVVLTRQSDNKVFRTQPVAAGGSFSFGATAPDKYHLYFVPATSVPAVNASFTTSILPISATGGAYVFTGEQLAATPGNDGLVDGRLTFSLGTTGAKNANFGLEQLPTTANSSVNTPNPMGYNFYQLPNGSFATADADGQVDSIVITGFPHGANYLKVGSTVYTNPSGGGCPPLFTCVAWPGTVQVQMAGGNPVSSISVDPSGNAAAAVSIPFYAIDNGQKSSATGSTLTINFTMPATPLSISGYVWQDANGNGIKESGELLTNAASAGQTLYAVLVQNTNTYAGVPTILYTETVTLTDPGFTFTKVPAGNDYQVRIYSLPSAPTPGQALSSLTPHLATAWTGVSTNMNGSISAHQHTNELIIELNSFNASTGNVSFGIEQIPSADDINHTLATAELTQGQELVFDGTELPALSGNDPEDGVLDGTTTGRTIKIITLPANGTLIYGTTAVHSDEVIAHFNPANLKLKMTGGGYNSTSFTYAYVDEAGVPSNPATYQLSWDTPLPVSLIFFAAHPENNDVLLNWETANEVNNKGFRIEHSTDARQWLTLDYINSAATGGNAAYNNNYSYRHLQPGAGVHYYRLYQEDLSGTGRFTAVSTVVLKGGSSVLVSPNPANQFLNISGSNIESVILTDLQGRMVQLSPTKSNKEWKLPTAHLAPGVYLLTVNQGGATVQHKIIIAH